MRVLASFVIASVCAVLTGCAGRTELLPNDNAALQKTPAEFAADAAKRHPYKADAPRGGQAKARAEIGYFLDRIDLINLSDTPWTDTEVWLNGEYVVFMPQVNSKKIEKIPFRAFYNGQGQYFPTSNGSILNRKPILINKVELFRDGMLYDVSTQTAE